VKARRLFLALVALAFALGPLGMQVHGLVHVVTRTGNAIAHAHDAGDHAGHGHEAPADRACDAFDGLVGAAACGAPLVLAAPPRSALVPASYYCCTLELRVAFSTRAPPLLVS